MKLYVPVLLVMLAVAGCGPEPAPARIIEAPGLVSPAPPPPGAIPQDAAAGPSGMDTATWFTDVLPQNGVAWLEQTMACWWGCVTLCKSSFETIASRSLRMRP